jgi:hypothetical protein
MNEKISQLTKKSGLILYRTKDIYNWEYAVEDFAALVVKECVKIVDNNDNLNGFVVRNLIKKHFGVEE